MDPFYERRLLDVQNGLRPLQTTPHKSPLKESYGDRFIPVRSRAVWRINFDEEKPNDAGASSSTPGPSQTNNPRTSQQGNNKSGSESSSIRSNATYSCLLKNELLGTDIDDVRYAEAAEADLGRSDRCRDVLQQHQPKDGRNLFQYRLSSSNPSSPEASPYSLSPVGNKSQQLLCSPRKSARKIPKIPYKVLDAPELQDDFYLNLVDWSSQNILSVGLGSCVYLWNAFTSQVTRLCDLSCETDSVTSVAWNEKGSLIAVGTHKGFTQIWDVTACKRITSLVDHSARVGALAWNGDLLASGSRDRSIILRDTRDPGTPYEKKWTDHRQEVCGLKWSPDKQYLASGGNDNKLILWTPRSNSALQVFADHLAAVKAIAWSPHQHGLLASGGGTADRRVRFWNTLTGRPIHSVDTGSQVCNLAWSKHSNELVSTHGYSQNQILIWKYPSLTQIAKLTGHTLRVLYLAMSPDGESIVTGAGDETLRFWNVFSKTQTRKEINSALNLFTRIR